MSLVVRVVSAQVTSVSFNPKGDLCMPALYCKMRCILSLSLVCLLRSYTLNYLSLLAGSLSDCESEEKLLLKDLEL